MLRTLEIPERSLEAGVQSSSSYLSILRAEARSVFVCVCLLNVYSFLRETEHERGRGRERERETQNPKRAPGSELSAQSPMQGLNSRTSRSQPEPKSDAQPTGPPRRP